MKIKIEDINHYEPAHFAAPHHHPAHAPAHPPAHPIPPEATCLIMFDDEDLDVLTEIFGDIDTARAACQIMLQAPPEIKLMFYFQLRIWRKLHDFNSSTRSNAPDAS